MGDLGDFFRGATLIDDERDQMIELKANQVSQAIFVLAFVGSMVPVVLGASISAMFVTLVGASQSSATTETESQLFPG